MKNQEQYSHGWHAEVWKIEQGPLLARAAEIKRFQNSKLGKKFFFEMKIASLLFPKNFIEVIGVLQTEDGFFAYSRKAPTPENHAIYTSHLNKYDTLTGKYSYCDCKGCKRHKSIHVEQTFKEKAVALYEKAKKIGIIVPIDDPSDYCIDRFGNVVFFEIERLIFEQTFNLLTSKKRDGLASINERKALRLLMRYEKIVTN